MNAVKNNSIGQHSLLRIISSTRAERGYPCKLGQTDLNVSVVCQGTWSVATKDVFWDGQDRADSLRAIWGGLDAGVNFFDSAPAYGNGESEEILGEALGSHRREVIVATKVAPTELEPDKLRLSCERSLRALRTDYIDLYQIHWPGKQLPLEPAWRMFEGLQREGKIRHIGVSNFGTSFLGDAFYGGESKATSCPAAICSGAPSSLRFSRYAWPTR